MYLIQFYVPETHVESVKNAMFDVGAGAVGEYSHCAWQTLGIGQFMPLSGSNPFIGTANQLEQVPEYKVEMVCAEELIEKAIEALNQAHPYETIAYQVIRCETNVVSAL